MSEIDTLVEMGFLRNRAEKAWAIKGESGVQAAMEWLLEHNEDPDIDEPYKPHQGFKLGSNDTVPQTEDQQSAEECKEESKPIEAKELTKEEKEEQVKKIQEKLKAKRLADEKEEKRRKIELEKLRRKDGKDLTKIKADIQWKEAQKAAEQRKREKREDIIARQKVKDQIARDRTDKKARELKEKQVNSSQMMEVPECESESRNQTLKSSNKTDHKTTRIQIRLPNGQPMIQQFSADEQLSVVRLYIEMNRTDGLTEPFDLMTTFPKRIYKDDEYNQSLKSLGLVPSAVLIVSKCH